MGYWERRKEQRYSTVICTVISYNLICEGKEKQMCASVSAYYSKTGDGVAVDYDPGKYDKPLNLRHIDPEILLIVTMFLNNCSFSNH